MFKMSQKCLTDWTNLWIHLKSYHLLFSHKWKKILLMLLVLKVTISIDGTTSSMRWYCPDWSQIKFLNKWRTDSLQNTLPVDCTCKNVLWLLWNISYTFIYFHWFTVHISTDNLFLVLRLMANGLGPFTARADWVVLELDSQSGIGSWPWTPPALARKQGSLYKGASMDTSTTPGRILVKPDKA